jgi:hypothetical protein
MDYQKPPGSPPCWGRQYDDSKQECYKNCEFRFECKQVTLHQIGLPTQRTQLPVMRSYAPPPVPSAPPRMLPPPATATVVALPKNPYFVPPPTTLPQPGRPIVPVPPQQQQQYYQQSTGYSLPNPANPNPMASWHRPGAPAPGYYFTQYPSESVGVRLAKNSILRAFEAIFGELMQFFRHWTWPPRT